MKKRLSMLLAMLLLVSLICGCGSSSSAKDAASNGAMPYFPMEEAADYEFSTAAPSASTASGSTVQLPQNRKWVITMDIDSETDDLDAAMAAVSQKLAAMGGYVEDQNFHNGSEYASRRSRSVYMTVRVPADQVDAFTEALSGTIHVVSSSRNVRDITLSYADTEGRITALRTEEARLLELMAQAEDMTDLLIIEERLTQVRYELESYSSQLRRYDNQVDYASISLSIEEVQQYTPVAKPTFVSRISTGFLKSIKDLGEMITDLVVWLIVDLPYFAILAVLVVLCILIVRATRRRSAARRAARYNAYMAQQAKVQQQAKTVPEEPKEE